MNNLPINNHTVKLTLILASSLIAGIIFFLIQNNIILIHCSLPPSKHLAQQTSICFKKKVQCSIWRDGKYLSEQQNIIWYKNDNASNIKQLINSWFAMLFEYHQIDYEVKAHVAVLSSFEHEACVNLSHSFIKPEQSILNKWCTVQSLLKTLQNADLPTQSIQLLVNGKELLDDHIDFSQPLCIQNYIEDKDLPL